MLDTFRILCLHGFTSNGAVHAHQARKIVKLFSASPTTSPRYEFLFPDGPHVVANSDIKDRTWHEYVAKNSTSGHRAWWFARDSNFTNPNAFVNPETGGYYGIEDSLTYLRELIERTGPIHAVWGFSQGACFAGMLMAMLSEASRDPLALRKLLPPSETQGCPMAGVFFGGFKARFEQYQRLYETGVRAPTLHVMGEDDVLVTVKRSEELVGVCKNAEVLKHQNGHNIPKEPHELERIADFLRENVK